MNFIPCSLKCKYQIDGYCELKETTVISNTNDGCPYQISPDKTDSLGKIFNSDNFNI